MSEHSYNDRRVLYKRLLKPGILAKQFTGRTMIMICAFCGRMQLVPQCIKSMPISLFSDLGLTVWLMRILRTYVIFSVTVQSINQSFNQFIRQQSAKGHLGPLQVTKYNIQ